MNTFQVREKEEGRRNAREGFHNLCVLQCIRLFIARSMASREVNPQARKHITLGELISSAFLRCRAFKGSTIQALIVSQLSFVLLGTELLWMKSSLML